MSVPNPHAAKRGLFGYIKGLFRRDVETDETFGAESYSESDLAEHRPLMPPPVEIAAPGGPQEFGAESAAAPTRLELDRQDGVMASVVALPLQPIIDGFNPELKKLVRGQAGDSTVNVALDKVLAQLAQGQVRVPFGDIRRAAPTFFYTVEEFDRVSVALPLGDILARLNPALLVRRTAVRQVEVPEDITSPFAGRGEGLNLLVGNAKPVPSAAPQPTAPVRPRAAGRGSSGSAGTALHQRQVQDIPAPISFNAPAPAAATNPIPNPRVVATPVPLRIPMPTATPAAAPKPVPHPVSAPAAPAPAFASAPAAPKVVSVPPAVLPVPLRSICESWPEALRAEITQTGLLASQVAVPADVVEAELKKGRVVFPWKTVRAWITPAGPVEVSAHDAAELELPLMVIAPLFLARKKADGGNRVAVDATIPNLFFGFPQSEPTAPAPTPVVARPVSPRPVPPSLPVPPAPATPTRSTTFFASKPPSARPTPAKSQPAGVPGSGLALPVESGGTSALTAAAASSAAAAAAAAAAAVTAAKALPRKPEETNYYLWADDISDTQQFHLQALKQKGSTSTEFLKRYASPNEIVTRAAALDGVAGALIALPDGLMVASRIPPEHNGETLAAFLPQIFAKVSSCTKELRMGELNNVSFTVGNVPWKIFRVNAIFFAAFGHPTQPLCTADLAALAAELDRKNK